MKQGLSFYLLIVLALSALTVLILVLAPGQTPDIPEVRLSPPPSQDAAAALPTEPPTDRTVIEITPETVQTVLRSLSRTDSYSRTLTVQRFWNGGESGSEIFVQARGDYLRLTVTYAAFPNGAKKNVLLKGGDAWIWYSDSGSVWHGRAKDGDAEAYQTLLDYRDVLTLNPSEILDAGYANYNGVNCVYVRYSSGALGYTHLCYISDTTGLLMGSETYDGAVLVYSMRSSLPDISTPGDEVFVEPQ